MRYYLQQNLDENGIIMFFKSEFINFFQSEEIKIRHIKLYSIHKTSIVFDVYFSIDSFELSELSVLINYDLMTIYSHVGDLFLDGSLNERFRYYYRDKEKTINEFNKIRKNILECVAKFLSEKADSIRKEWRE